MIALIVYFAVFSMLLGWMCGHEDALVRATKAEPQKLWISAAACALWPVVFACVPTYVFGHWWTSRQPDVIAARLRNDLPVAKIPKV